MNDDSKTVTVKQKVINECGRALDELDLQDKLIASQEKTIEALNGRLDSEKQSTNLALQLADSHLKQATSLEEANNALHEAVTAKDAIIANNSKEIELLKKKKLKILDILKAVAAGIAIGLVLK